MRCGHWEKKPRGPRLRVHLGGYNTRFIYLFLTSTDSTPTMSYSVWKPRLDPVPCTFTKYWIKIEKTGSPQGDEDEEVKYVFKEGISTLWANFTKGSENGF